MSKYIWVVKTFIAARAPTVTRYVLLKEAKNGYFVDKRGTVVLVRFALSRRFFINESDMRVYLLTWFQDALRNAQAHASNCQYAIETIGRGDLTYLDINEIPDGATLDSRRKQKKTRC